MALPFVIAGPCHFSSALRLKRLLPLTFFPHPVSWDAWARMKGRERPVASDARLATG